MGTIPSSPSFVAGEKLTAAKLEQMNDVADFLKTPPQCMAYHSAAQTFTTATWGLVTFTSEVFDVANVFDGGSDSPHHDNATDPSRIYFRTAGKYEISGQITFVSNATNARQAAIRKNSNGDTTFATGTEQNANKQDAVSGIATSVPMIPVVLPFSVGDYIEMFAWQNSGGNLDSAAGQSLSFMRIRWVSP